MKRILKVIALVLAVVMLAVTLCSCQHLDDLRAHQAFFTDSTKRSIEFDGQLYQWIEVGKRAFVFSDLWSPEAYHVTERDVPVLLAQNEGDWFEINNERTVIMMYNFDNPRWYVRQDLYDDAKEKLQSAELDHYYFGYVIYPENYEDPIASSYQKNILLDDEVTGIVHRALELPKDQRVSYKELSDDYYTSKYIVLYACDADMLIQEEGYIHLIKDSGRYYVWDGNTYEEKSFCPITDEKDTESVKALFKDYPDAVYEDNFHSYYENDYYYDDYEYVDEYVVNGVAVAEERHS